MGEVNAAACRCRSREHSYLVALRDGYCDNDDRLVVRRRSHALRNIVCMRAFLAAAVSLVVREDALTWSRSATGAMTMMTRHSRALRSHTSGFYMQNI